MLWPLLTASLVSVAICVFWIIFPPPVNAHFHVVEVPGQGIDLYLKNEGPASFSIPAGRWRKFQSTVEEGVLMISEPVEGTAPKSLSSGSILIGGAFSGWNGYLKEVKKDESNHIFSLNQIRPQKSSTYLPIETHKGDFLNTTPSPETASDLPSTFVITIRAEKQLSRYGRWKNKMMGKYSQLDQWFERTEPDSVQISSDEFPLPANFFGDLIDLEESNETQTGTVIFAD